MPSNVRRREYSHHVSWNEPATMTACSRRVAARYNFAMSAWRRKVVDLFPDLERELEGQFTSYNVFTHLLVRCRDAHRQENEAELKKSTALPNGVIATVPRICGMPPEFPVTNICPMKRSRFAICHATSSQTFSRAYRVCLNCVWGKSGSPNSKKNTKNATGLKRVSRSEKIPRPRNLRAGSLSN